MLLNRTARPNADTLPSLARVGRGSWVVGRGSWVSSRGSWVLSRGSWVPGRGSWVIDWRGSVQRRK